VLLFVFLDTFSLKSFAMPKSPKCITILSSIWTLLGFKSQWTISVGWPWCRYFTESAVSYKMFNHYRISLQHLWEYNNILRLPLSMYFAKALKSMSVKLLIILMRFVTNTPFASHSKSKLLNASSTCRLKAFMAITIPLAKFPLYILNQN